MGLSISMTSVSLFGQERAFFYSIRSVLCHVEIDLPYNYCRDPFKKHRRRIHLHLRVASEKLITECPSLSLRSRDLLCVLERVTTILVKIDRSRHDTS